MGEFIVYMYTAPAQHTMTEILAERRRMEFFNTRFSLPTPVDLLVYYHSKASRAAEAQCMTAKSTGCGSPLEDMEYLFKFIFSFRRGKARC